MATTCVLLRCPHNPDHGVAPYQLLCTHLTRGRHVRDWHEVPTGEPLREVDADYICSGCWGIFCRKKGLDELVNAGKIECLCFMCVDYLKMAAGFKYDSAMNLVKP